MLAVESYLVEAGSEDLSKLRGALDAFFAHWDRLEERAPATWDARGPVWRRAVLLHVRPRASFSSHHALATE